MWPPTLPDMPPMLAELFRALIARIDGNEPKDGHGARVSDATGGGKSIDATGGTGGNGVILKDCVFYDPDATLEEDPEQVGLFFYTDVYTTGKRKIIEPPE